MKPFIICHRGALGDFLLTWPALQCLREHLRGHHFLGIGRPEYMGLAKAFGLLDSSLDMEGTGMLRFFSGTLIPPAMGDPASIAIRIKLRRLHSPSLCSMATSSETFVLKRIPPALQAAMQRQLIHSSVSEETGRTWAPLFDRPMTPLTQRLSGSNSRYW